MAILDNWGNMSTNMNNFIEKEIVIENSNLKEVWISNRYVMVRAGIFNHDSSIYSIIIPEPVNRICNAAFSRCEELTSVSLPDSLCSIGSFAFGCCRKLKTITIPRNVKYIGGTAFAGCNELTCVKILGNVLPNFSRLKKMSSIIIGENLKEFSIESFSECKNIKTIVVDENNKTYDSRNNCNAIIETASDTLIYACNSTKIPEGIKHISAGAFENCGRKKTLALPGSLVTIESLPENVKKIIIPKGRKQEFKKSYHVVEESYWKKNRNIDAKGHTNGIMMNSLHIIQ